LAKDAVPDRGGRELARCAAAPSLSPSAAQLCRAGVSLAKDAVTALKAGAVQRGRALLDAQVVEGQPAALQFAADGDLGLVRPRRRREAVAVLRPARADAVLGVGNGGNCSIHR